MTNFNDCDSSDEDESSIGKHSIGDRNSLKKTVGTKNCRKHNHDKEHSCNCSNPEFIKRFSSVLNDLKSGKNPSKVSVQSGTQTPKNIEKRLIRGSVQKIPAGCEAAGGGLEYPKESKFIFHYQIRKMDEEHTVLDDTRKYNKLMELYSGKEFQLDFWEHCLGTMLPGEVASFSVPVERLGAFPAVNKKLRDYMLDKKGSAAKHCCGLMSLQEQGGLGYPDLDELMVKPEPLEFIFDLVRVDIPGSGRKDTWIMSAEERADLIPKLKDEGNQFYVSGDFSQAAARYSEALGILEQLVLREKPGEPEWKALDNSRVTFFLNLAQCQFKMKDYYAVIRNTTEALSRDPSNVKALYRRAKAYVETWDLDLAAEDFRKVSALSLDMKSIIETELKALEIKRKNQEQEERHHLAGKLLGR